MPCCPRAHNAAQKAAGSSLDAAARRRPAGPREIWSPPNPRFGKGLRGPGVQGLRRARYSPLGVSRPALDDNGARHAGETSVPAQRTMRSICAVSARQPKTLRHTRGRRRCKHLAIRYTAAAFKWPGVK
ncbi:hypothetical protein MRX96_015135 [Rhipicephalus microplus]